MTFTDKEVNRLVDDVYQSYTVDKEKDLNDQLNKYMDYLVSILDDDGSLFLRGYVLNG